MLSRAHGHALLPGTPPEREGDATVVVEPSIPIVWVEAWLPAIAVLLAPAPITRVERLMSV